MRAPILNDRGQFRYSDLVAYIPEYLKAEPDVVTLLQVFSDYINNAYRNIETVEKFEFAIVSRSDTIGRAKRKMEYLRTMLDLAGSRHDFVNLLSAPRANIKSNRVFGQSTGYTPLVATYSAPEVVDEIQNASSVVPGIREFDDGDVIFVSYDEMEDGTKEIAYYYDSSRNMLIREPMGKSQDPFTGSDNTSGRILSFHISDISSVKERYGYTSDNGTQYKELFFTARIYDVQSAPATKKYTLNGGLTGMVDYYGTERVDSDALSSTMRFWGDGGWNWKNGFPTAMIYLSETSGANLVSTTCGDDKHLPLALCADPSMSGEFLKYPVTALAPGNGGTVVATLATYYPSYANSTVHLALKRSMEIVGTFTVVQDTRETGSYDVTLIPIGKGPILDDDEEYVIVDAPLFYNRGMLDYGKASPIVNLKNFYPIDIATTEDSSEEPRYTYFKLDITDVPGPEGYMQLSELEFYDKNNRKLNVVYVTGTPGTYSDFGDENPTNMFDGRTDTKWCVRDKNVFVIGKIRGVVNVSKYRMATANDCDHWPGRNPSRWTISMAFSSTDIMDRSSDLWTVIDTRNSSDTMPDVNQTYYCFEINHPENQILLTKAETTRGTMKLSGFGIDSDSLVPGKNIVAYACDTIGNDKVGTLNIYHKNDASRPSNAAYLNGSNTIILPYSSELAKNFGSKYDIGSELYIRGSHMYWEGVAVVAKFELIDDGYAMTLNGLHVQMQPEPLDTPVDVYVNQRGYIELRTDPSTGVQSLKYMNKVQYPLYGDAVFAFDEVTGTAVPSRYIVKVSRQTKILNLGLPDGCYAITQIDRASGYAANLLTVTQMDGYLNTIWGKSHGDMFTCQYVMIKDGLGNVSICDLWNESGKEVMPLVNGMECHAGQYVYSKTAGRVYLCVEDCIVTDESTATSGNWFAEDRIVHYSVPYVEKINAFAPFYGQISAMEYGSQIDYKVDPEVFTCPMYITKVEEKTLKYGWEHREFLNYGDAMNLSGRARNGMVEFHTTERTNSSGDSTITADSMMDIVDTDLATRSIWSYDHPIVTHGCASYSIIDIDDQEFLVVSRIDTTTWRVTVHSADHGLVDGSRITVEGIPEVSARNGTLDINVSGAPIIAVDGDTFTYDVVGDPELGGKTCYAEYAGGSIRYIQDHNVAVADITGDIGMIHVNFVSAVHRLYTGDSVYLEGCFVDGEPYPNGPYEVCGVDDDFRGISLKIPLGNIPVPGGRSIIRKPISEGDIIMITDEFDNPIRFYEVTSGPWVEVERNSLLTPLTVFTQNNLFDVSDTNPSVAFGDPITIRDIIYTGNGRATVHVATALPHFIQENREYIEGKTVVYITNVTPTDFGGFHVVEHINSPSSFEISMRLYNKTNNMVDSQKGIPTSDLDMTLQECRWYRYEIDELEWDKCSAIATFTGKNVTTMASRRSLQCDGEHGLSLHEDVLLETSSTTGGGANTATGTVVAVTGPSSVEIQVTGGTYVDGMHMVSANARKRSIPVTTTEEPSKELVCEHAHGLSVGDYVIMGDDFSLFDESTGLNNYAMGQVTAVPDDTMVTINVIYGMYREGMSIARGIMTLPGMDNIVRRYGEYGIRIRSLLGEGAASDDYGTSQKWVKYEFREGDIILAAGQLVPSERLAYLVRSSAQWSVLKKKRIMKIRKITVDEYTNPAFMDASSEDNQDEFKYTTYSDVDVAKAASWAYASRMNMVRNPVFNKPAINNIDTTREVNAEYSSGEDFANVVPRNDMKSSFVGIPDMKYPLIEKIERLAYLRDANVIDFDLIGYLARFMGYDLTPMSEDIENSNLYRTVKQRENAIREAVMNLPQYYALGGTNAGLKMIMGAFGVIGDILTLYTNTMNPYGEMLNKEEVEARLESDTESGSLSGSWVSTPYIDIELTDDARYPQFAIQHDDISRIKEQIRLWKPINVVFRDILLRYAGEIDMTASLTGPFIGIGEFGTAIGVTEGDVDNTVDPDYVDPDLTNCAF